MEHHIIVMCYDERCSRSMDLEFGDDPDFDEIKDEIEERGWSTEYDPHGQHKFWCELHAPESEDGGGF